MWAVCRFYFYVNEFPFCRYRTIARLSGSFVLGKTFECESAKGLVCVQGEDPIGAREVKTFEVCAKQRPTSRAEFMETREVSERKRTIKAGEQEKTHKDLAQSGDFCDLLRARLFVYDDEGDLKGVSGQRPKRPNLEKRFCIFRFQERLEISK